MEQAEKRVTKLIRELKHLPYEDRLGVSGVVQLGKDSYGESILFKARLDKAFEHPHLVGVVLSQDSEFLKFFKVFSNP